MFQYTRQAVAEESKARISARLDAKKFVLSGDATFTIVSRESGVRYTYRIRQKSPEDRFWFVQRMYGPDNEADFRYIGWLRETNFFGLQFGIAKNTAEDRPIVAVKWLLQKALFDDDAFEQIEFWHEGRCGRCGRKLTVPESIASGFGPECINHV